MCPQRSPAEARSSLHLFGRAGSVTGGGCCRDGVALHQRVRWIRTPSPRRSRWGGCLSLGDGRLGLLRRRRGRRGGRKRVLRVVSRAGGAGDRRGVFALRTAEAAGQSEEQGGGASGGAHRAATPIGGAYLSVVKRHCYLLEMNLLHPLQKVFKAYAYPRSMPFYYSGAPPTSAAGRSSAVHAARGSDGSNAPPRNPRTPAR